LSGKSAPMPVVLHQAEAKQVPIIQAEGGVATLVASIEASLSKARFGQEKLPGLMQILEKHFDFGMLDQALGLAS
jgi:hypothetical protein